MEKSNEMRKGFTLIELMIVVAIIAIIAAIAIPNLLRSRMSANEASAIGSMRTIASAEMMFQTSIFADADGDGSGDYGTLAQLGNPDGAGVTAPFVDAVLATGAKQGYAFTVTITVGAVGSAPTYTCAAIPQTPGQSGYRQFFVDETGVLRFTSDGSAVGAGSTPLS